MFKGKTVKQERVSIEFLKKGEYVTKLEEIRKEYLSQDNRSTAFPYYVEVQELISIGVIKDGYSVNCPCGDGVTKEVYVTRGCGEDEQFDTEREAKESIRETMEDCSEEEIKEAFEDIEEMTLGYIWYPVQFCLTIKGAQEYIQANKHNHGKLRDYVNWFHYRNYEMQGLMKEIMPKKNYRKTVTQEHVSKEFLKGFLLACIIFLISELLARYFF